uniref:SET domain-containing protein n=1 Tax=Eutreptiella gymnastica TaxID=73025 RepID=A0A7S1J1Z7_9EUGL|mmetsp:Transcript_60722/g.108314  ORF Transcript_60722/g.108314 Transcript_60722/m.108314 type:complete len:456 (+) Transcript_60722:41-1408(+)
MALNGVPMQKAKAKWAKLDANPNIIVLETRIVDNAACAARDFSIGETVFQEEPLIVLPRQKGEEVEVFNKLEQIALTAGLGGNYLFSIYHFSKATEETKGRILEFFCPDLDKEGADYKRYIAACKAVVALPQFNNLDPEDLVRYLLVLRTNQHATGRELECSALYELGSKVTHSCEPNCLCTMNGTTIEYRAIRNIKKHDMLTFSYISAFDLWKSTLERRRIMAPARFFECCCSRCVGPDYTRRMRCPECKDPRMLYYMPGQVSFVPTVGEKTETPWTCKNEKCGKKWRDDELNLGLEQKIVSAVISTYFDVQAGTIQDRATAKQMLQYCDQELGPYHFASALMVYTQLALTHSAIKNGHAKAEPPEVVLPLSERLMYWFCINFPGTMEEANIASFLGGLAQLHGAYKLGARFFSTALPLLRVHWKTDHPHIVDMEAAVDLHGDEKAKKHAAIAK